MKTSIINGSEVSKLSVAIHAEIKHTSKDKVIIFTELRDLQRELQHAIHQNFGFRPVIINGDTSTKSQSQNNRQRLIDDFQAQPRFGVIILSLQLLSGLALTSRKPIM